MNDFGKNIIGKRIKTVLYSEVNHPNGPFYFNRFDTFDYAINVEMEDRYWWNLGWKNEDYFEFGKGKFEHGEYLGEVKIKSWDATERWNAVRHSVISDFKIAFMDEAGHIPSKIQIEFENAQKIRILIAQELNRDGSLPHPLEYDFAGEIYVFHDEI